MKDMLHNVQLILL